MKCLYCSMLVFFLFGCTNTKVPPIPPLKDIPQQESYGVEMTFTQNGRERSKMRTSKMVQRSDNEPLQMSGGVRVIFLDTLGNRSGFLLSKEATIDENRQSFRAIGDVYVWSDESKTALESKSLSWNPNTHRIETFDSVRISSDRDTLYGIGLVADEGLKFAEMQQVYGKSYREMPDRKRPNAGTGR